MSQLVAAVAAVVCLAAAAALLRWWQPSPPRTVVALVAAGAVLAAGSPPGQWLRNAATAADTALASTAGRLTVPVLAAVGLAAAVAAAWRLHRHSSVLAGPDRWALAGLAALPLVLVAVPGPIGAVAAWIARTVATAIGWTLAALLAL